MTLLLVGIALWIVAHLFKRILPGARAAMQDRMGNGSKGVIALILLVGIVLMVIGYRGADFIYVYDPPGWGMHLNNLLMLIAVILLGAGNSKGRLRAALRHPMLTGVLIWAIGHLLVNGDLASLILFGAMGVWAILEMLVINATEKDWQRPEPGPVKGDIRLLIISVVVYAVIAGIHMLVGPSPFPVSS